MIELGALGDEIVDTGIGRINLPNGRIEPVTAAALSRVGAKVTFAIFDEVGLWTDRNGGTKVGRAMSRNLAGMQGRAVCTSNAYDPSEKSYGQEIVENPKSGYFIDDIEPPENLSVRNKQECRRAIRYVYGDAITGTRNGVKGAIKGWVDPDRIVAEVEALCADRKSVV